KSSPYTPNVGVQFIEPEGRVRNLLALFGGLLFVCHPIQTQAVTYIIQRAASFATFWYLLTLCLYAKARLSSASRPYYLCSIISASLALFTKETAVTLPFILIVWEICFFRKFTKRTAKWIVPFFLPLLATLVIIRITDMDKELYGSALISSKDYLLTQFRVIVTYLRLLLIPINQNLDYDYPIVRSLFNLPVFASLILLLSILATGFILFRKYRLLSFGVFWFFLTLAPESSIIPIKDVIFEHRLYLPMVGYCIFLPSLCYYFFPRRFLRFLPVLLIVVVTIYGISTYHRNSIWKDEIALWNDTVSKSPNKARPYNNRGILYLSRGKYDQALADFNRAVMIAPDCADAYLNRGEIYHEKGDYDKALADFTQVLKIAPGYAKAFCNRGVLYENRGEYEKAITEYTQAIKLDRNYVQVHFNRGNAYLNKKEFDKAIADYTRAIALTPTNAAAYNNRGFAYFLKNDYTSAWQDLTQAKTLGYQVPPELFKILNQNAKYGSLFHRIGKGKLTYGSGN
ncbi:MAG: tetratricopeptide repeat protein, partial [Candidatus Omnitrophota bacterium]